MPRLHDATTQAAYYLACLAMLSILVVMNGEIVLRYFFNAPTKWSADLVTYLMLATIAFGMPQVARTRGHIAITIIGERLSPYGQKVADFARNALTLIVVAGASIFIVQTAADEFQKGVLTVAAFQIPKWILNASLGYGFVSSGIHLLRHLFAPSSHQATSPAEGMID